MRTLLLLRGAPGSGKSTWIKNNGLSNYTLEADKYRIAICNPVLTEDGQFVISQNNDKVAWNNLFRDLETRMQNGDFTIIDATHANPRSFAKYKNLVETYRYRVFVKTFDADWKTLLSRNDSRPKNKQIPESALLRMHVMFNNTCVPKWVTKIDDISEIEDVQVDNVDKYCRVMVIGDVHGCYVQLMQMINGGFRDDTLYVFCGDYLDRGPENKKMLNFILENYQRKNVVLIEGNHEMYLRNWSYGVTVANREFNKNTKLDITNGIKDVKALMKRVRQMTRSLYQLYAFSFRGQKYFVCHGGLSMIPKTLYVSTQQIISGVGCYTTPIDEIFERNRENHYHSAQFIQIHGHRMTDSTQHSICVDGHVESGGQLKAYVIDGEGSYMKTIDGVNHVDLTQAKDDLVISDKERFENIKKSQYIKLKMQPKNNLVSINFTREAFNKSVWNSITLQARGLYVDIDTGQVRMRSYDKFFNIGEQSETTVSYLSEHIVPGFRAWKKENGFLGMMSTIDGKVILGTKSCMYGDACDIFTDDWNKLVSDEDKVTLSRVSKENNCSFIFEVLDKRDRHIIDIDHNEIVLLDAVKNSYDSFSEDYSERILNDLMLSSIRKKEFVGTFETMDDLMKYIHKHDDDKDIEGLVIHGKDKFTNKDISFKVKFNYYKCVKKLRSVLYSVIKVNGEGVSYQRLHEAYQVKFASWLETKPLSTYKNAHIIDVVRQFLKENPDFSFNNGHGKDD